MEDTGGEDGPAGTPPGAERAPEDRRAAVAPGGLPKPFADAQRTRSTCGFRARRAVGAFAAGGCGSRPLSPRSRSAAPAERRAACAGVARRLSRSPPRRGAPRPSSPPAATPFSRPPGRSRAIPRSGAEPPAVWRGGRARCGCARRRCCARRRRRSCG